MHKYNAEAEEAVLGCLISDNEKYFSVSKLINQSHFYDKCNRVTFELISELVAAGNPADIVTVFSLARSKGLADEIGGRSRLSALTDHAPISSNSDYYAKLIRDAARERVLHIACESVVEELSSGVANYSEQISRLNAVLSDTSGIEEESFASTASKVLQSIIENQGKPIKLEGIDTGSSRLNGAIDGLCPENLIILGARPRMGKSAYALQLARQAANQGHKVLFLSCEMSVRQLTKRLMNQLDVKKEWFKANDLADYKMEMVSEVVAMIHNMSITPVHYTTGYNELQGTIVSHIKQGVDLVILDYIQKIPKDDDKCTEAEHIKKISGLLKNIAVTHKIPVVGLAQLNRETVKGRASKKPRIEDLYGSSALEADADVILLLNRPGEYEDSEEDRSVTELSVAKNREGEAGFEIAFNFDLEKQTFHEVMSNNGGQSK